MKLYTIYFTYGEHEMENEVFAHTGEPKPTTADGRVYLLKKYGGERGYMYGENLFVEDVRPFTVA